MAVKTFSVGETLTASDTNTYLANAGLVVVTPSSVTGGTLSGSKITIGSAQSSVVVSGAFSATYDAYKIVVTGGSISAVENVRLKLGSSATGYYDGVLYLATSAPTTPASSGTSNGALFARIGAGDTNGINVSIDVLNPYLSKYTSFFGSYNFPGTPAYPGIVNGVHQVASSYTDFTISPGSGTFTGGTIMVYGYRLG